MISGIIALVSLGLAISYNTKMKNLDNYLSRIGLPSLQQLHDDEFQTDRATLALVMDGQSRSIAFENLDVVMKKTISMNGSDVEKKLVDDLRGGYCWEQNTLLQMALEEMGYSVKPLLCRVRWGKPDDTEGPNTGYTHFALKVTTADGCHFLADVGFAGTNSVEPINLDVGPESQELPEGCFRVVASTHERFHVLELLVKEEWRPLYEWCDEKAPLVDQESCNWFSCTYPTARFTNQLFTCLIVGDERHHILSDQYVIRRGHGAEKEVTTETITDKNRLLELIDGVFGVKLVETEGVDRYLN
jgi:N-hydroxyarylamine O-acetyltransferase